MTKRKKRRKLKVKNLIIIILLFFVIILGVKYGVKSLKKVSKVVENKVTGVSEADKKKEEEQKKLLAYNECVIKKYSEEELNDDLKNKIDETTNFIKNNYYASFLYEDINTGLTLKLGEDNIYYGASLIKLVEAEYLIDKADSGEIDLNEKLVYAAKYKAGFSDGMKNKKIGEEVSLQELMSYAIMYSDNSAHFMISDYIGVSNLKEYGKKMGAKNILNGGDTFGSQSPSDTNIYLHHAYEIIESGSENGKLLKQYMMNTEVNALNLMGDENNNVAHKYGQYGSVYHDIGIVYEEYPYYISILTNHGAGNYTIKVNEIHKKINEFHNYFYDYRKNSCHLEIYGS